MRIEQQMVAEFHKAAGDQDPQVPTIPSLEVRILRAKLMLEECLETISKGLGLAPFIQYESDDPAYKFDFDDINFNEIHSGNLVEIADGCADLKYVTYGTELACGIDGATVFDEVHASNMTKFLDAPHEHGKKVQKGPSFRPPDIEGVLEAQANREIYWGETNPGDENYIPTLKDYSFRAINSFAHDPDVSFEDLQGALLSVGARLEFARLAAR